MGNVGICISGSRKILSRSQVIHGTKFDVRESRYICCAQSAHMPYYKKMHEQKHDEIRSGFRIVLVKLDYLETISEVTKISP